MDYFNNLFNGIPKYLNKNCGHCKGDVNFQLISNDAEKSSNDKIGTLYLCPRCKETSLFIFYKQAHDMHSEYILDKQYPKMSYRKIDDLPSEIEHDRNEAWSCFFSENYKASGIMARAALQRAMRKLEAKGGNLYSEIEDLKNKGIIVNDLASFAHEIRITGNEMAHPSEITSINKQEIEESLEFLDNFLHIVFVLPQTVSKRKTNRSK